MTTLFLLCLFVLTSCVPTAEKYTEFDSDDIQSINILRNRDEVTVTWGVSGELSSYATWIEFYDEDVARFLISTEQYAGERVIHSSQETLFSDTFQLREIASFEQEGTREIYALLFYIAIQSGEGRVIHSEPNYVTFFTTIVEDEK